MKNHCEFNGVRIVQDDNGTRIIITTEFREEYKDTTLVLEEAGLPGVCGPDLEFNIRELASNEVAKALKVAGCI